MPRTTAARRPRAPRGQGERLRADILDAAGRLLADTGDEAKVSIRAVADAVGVTPPSIYLHFADKDALLAEVCDVRFREFDRVVESAGVAADADPLAGLAARGRAYVAFGLANPEHYRLLFMTRRAPVASGADPWEGHEAGRAAFEHLVAATARAIAAGAIAGEPTSVALQLWAAMHGVTSLLIALPGFPWPDPDQLVGDTMRTLVAGLRP
jgi:AcrR family transcriptional regulator